MKKYIYYCKFCGFELCKEDCSCPNCGRETTFAWKSPPEYESIEDEWVDLTEEEL